MKFKLVYILPLIAFLASCNKQQDGPDNSTNNNSNNNRTPPAPALDRKAAIDKFLKEHPNNQTGSRSVAMRVPVEPEAKPETPKTSDDQTLVIIAKLAQQQDELQKKLNEIEHRDTSSGSALASALENQTQQLQRLRDELPEIIKKSAPARVVPTPAPAPVIATQEPVPPKEIPVTPEARIPEPADRSFPPSPVQKPKPVEVAKVETVKVIAKWTPYAQQLRAEVRKTYQKVIDEYPKSHEAMDAYMGLAVMAEEDEDWVEAIDQYQKLLTNFPNDPACVEAQFHLAGAFEKKGQLTDARRLYLQTADTFPNNTLAIPALLAAADCLVKTGDSASALREYKAIERTRSETVFAQTAREKIAETLAKDKKYPEAIEAYQNAINNGPDERHAELKLQLAMAQLSAGQYPNARATLTELLTKGNDDAFSWKVRWHIARAFEEEDNPLDAARSFAQVADQYPKASAVLDARMHAAHAFLSAELSDHALEQIDLALKDIATAPNDVRTKYEPQALFTAARAARLSGNIEKEKAFLSKLRSSYPSDILLVDADLDEANTLANNNHTDEAISLLRQIVHKNPRSPRTTAALLRISELQERSGRPSRSIALYSELLNSGNTDAMQSAQYKLRRGMLLVDVGREKEAREIYQGLLSDTNTPKAIAALARYQCAALDQRDGMLAESIAQYERFLEESSGSTALIGVDLEGLIADAKWKISKLKWLSETQVKPEGTGTPKPVSINKGQG